ncbi:hypothetical protein FO519_009344 [Halicephalobus sp. NKZ332]|nr:hypothetical protein FO519_009344 [Halicephalobus sp. NKZ332]
MSTQSESSTQKPKDKILIQRIDTQTMKIYNDLKITKKLKETSFSALRSTRVTSGALIEILNKYKGQFDSKKLKTEIDIMITKIDGKVSGGAQMFISHDNEKDLSKLEYICLVIHKYNIEGGEACGKCEACNVCKKRYTCGSCLSCKACQSPIACNQCRACKASRPVEKCQEPIVCGTCRACERCRITRSCGKCEECRKCKTPMAWDYLLTTYSYKDRVNNTGLGIGIATIVGGVIAGAISLPVGIFTGGVGFTITGAIIAAIVSTAGTIGGSAIISKKAEQCANSFVSGLPTVKHAAITDMAFMGCPKLNEFVDMKAALEKQDWKKAAAEARNSKWCTDVKAHRCNLDANCIGASTSCKGGTCSTGCKAETCSTYTYSCSSNSDCTCFQTQDGSGFCGASETCNTVSDCSLCPVDTVCQLNTCCGSPHCAPLSDGDGCTNPPTNRIPYLNKPAIFNRPVCKEDKDCPLGKVCKLHTVGSFCV